MTYDYYHYNHIGAYRCTRCDFRRPETAFTVTDADLDAGFLTINGKDRIELAFKSIYNAYNILACYTVCALAGVDGGRYDSMANGVEITEERAQKYDFSDPYCYIRTAIIVKSDDDSINSFEDLNGKTTANTISSTYATLAESYGAKTTGVDDLNQTIELLLNGRVDATLNAEVTYFDYLKEHPDANIKIAALTNDASQVAFPVRKGDETATLREALNQAINELREDGTIAEISEKYFGTDLSQAPSAN